MALSGSISSPPVTFGNYIRLDWERIATNTTNRTSTIRYRLYLVLVTGSWVDATESFSISTMDGSSDGSRGVTYRGPGGTHLIHEYTNTVTHYDGDPVTLGAMATLRSGWNQLGTVITDFGTWTLDAMSLPTAPNTKYWVGGTGTWDNTAGSKWSTSPGGAGGASVPQPNEDVVISGAGTVTLGIDTPAVRQLTVGTPINLNGKTVTCARAQFNMQNFSLGSATINAYNSISFSTQTIDLGTGTLRVTHGSTLTIGGSPYAGGFHVSPWTTTVTAGTSLIEVNVNPGTGNSMDVVLGAHTYNIMRIIIGGASTGAVSVALSGSPTFHSLIIQSKNSAAHTVNFEADITVNKFIGIGSSTSNRLTLHGQYGTEGLLFTDYGSSYASNLNFDASYMYDKATFTDTTYPLYIGSSSTSGADGNISFQDPPKISTLVDPLTTAPGSNTNWTVTGTVSQVTTGSSGGGYIVSSGKLVSTGTYDFVDSDIMFELPETTVGAYPVALTIGVNEVPGGLDPIYPTPGLLAAVTRLNDAAMMGDSAYSGWRGGSSYTSLTGWYSYEDIVPKVYYKIRVNSSTNKVEVRSSTNGISFSLAANLDIQSGTLEMFKSARLVVDAVQRGGAGTPIGSINPTLASPSNANFLQFFGGL